MKFIGNYFIKWQLLYLLKSDKAVEHFWTFVNPCGHYTVSLAEIKMTLHQVTGQNKEKLMLQTCDGAHYE